MRASSADDNGTLNLPTILHSTGRAMSKIMRRGRRCQDSRRPLYLVISKAPNADSGTKDGHAEKDGKGKASTTPGALGLSTIIGPSSKQDILSGRSSGLQT